MLENEQLTSFVTLATASDKKSRSKEIKIEALRAQILEIPEKMERKSSTSSLSNAETEQQTILDELLEELEPKDVYAIKNINGGYFKYKGETLNDKRHGFGLCKFRNGDYYKGQWVNDNMEGFGRLMTKDNDLYEGEFRNNLPNGYIEKSNAKGTTRGIMKDAKFEDDGIIICKKKDKYIIEAKVSYKGDLAYGIGVINDFQGNLYEGELLNFTPHGWGIQVKKNKFVYKGQQNKGFNGYGEVYCADGSKYFGNYKDNKKHGIVLSFNVKEERISIAKYIEDSKNGASLNVYKNGLKVEIWHDGFLVKLLENFDLAKGYIKSCYPEYEWVVNLEYMNMINYFGKLKL